jgi:hypothetical protein
MCRNQALTEEKPVQFMMLMIPNVYRGNRKLEAGFAPDPKDHE